MKGFLFCATIIAAIGLAGWVGPQKPIHREASAVVYISMGEAKQVDNDGQTEVSFAHGTGVSIGRGYVLTAAHVADDTDFGQSQLKIVDSLGKTHGVEVLWANHKYDVALLHMSGADDVASDHLSCRYLDAGEKLTFVGNPYSLHNITTWGRVANSSIEKIGPWGAINTVNASIDPGMSGGPAFDAHGDVVGINVGAIPGSGLGTIVPGRVICRLMAR